MNHQGSQMASYCLCNDTQSKRINQSEGVMLMFLVVESCCYIILLEKTTLEQANKFLLDYKVSPICFLMLYLNNYTSIFSHYYFLPLDMKHWIQSLRLILLSVQVHQTWSQSLPVYFNIVTLKNSYVIYLNLYRKLTQ